MQIDDLKKTVRILERKLARCEENRILLEEALESHITALKVGIEELTKSHETINISNERFKQLALHDTLTSLPSRILLSERLERSLHHAKIEGHTLAVLFIDLDNFKYINDAHGHHVGDIVLRETSSRLLSSVRDIDTVCRFAGDEFVVLLEKIKDRLEAEIIADRMVAALRVPINFDSKNLTTSASIGISIFPSDGEQPDDLLKKADVAMYNAKKSTGDSWQFYSDCSMFDKD